MTDAIPNQVVMQPVESSQIKAIGHDPANNRLYIEFPKKTGRSVYSYENISPTDHAALMGVGVEGHSIGRHFGQHIKPAVEKHPFKKLQLEEEG